MRLQSGRREGVDTLSSSRGTEDVSIERSEIANDGGVSAPSFDKEGCRGGQVPPGTWNSQYMALTPIKYGVYSN